MDYIFIRACIFLLHLVAPASVIYSVANMLLGSPFQLPRALHLWLGLETGFYLAIYLPYREYLQKPARHPTPPCREDRRKLFWRCHKTIPDPVQYLRQWFRGALEVEIKRENVKDFFRWAFLNTGKFDPEVEEEVEEYTREMEELLGRELEHGRGKAECLRLTLDKVEMLHRSLTWYLVSLYSGALMLIQANLLIFKLLVRGYCRHVGVNLFEIPLLRLLPHIFPALSCHLPLAPSHSLCQPSLCWRKPHLLASPAYIQD